MSPGIEHTKLLDTDIYCRVIQVYTLQRNSTCRSFKDCLMKLLLPGKIVFAGIILGTHLMNHNSITNFFLFQSTFGVIE